MDRTTSGSAAVMMLMRENRACGVFVNWIIDNIYKTAEADVGKGRQAGGCVSKRLKGKRIIITAAASGISKAAMARFVTRARAS